ncbi:MAG: VOC family protein [Thermoplasmata archaeon]
MPPAETPRVFRVLFEAKDLARSRSFYETLLAAVGREVGGGRVYFDCGPVLVAIVDRTAKTPDPPAPPNETVYFSTSDLDGVHARARRLGCLTPGYLHDDPTNPLGEIVVRPWGERSFYATDPAGNPLCFVDSRTVFTGIVPSSPGSKRAGRMARHTRPSGSTRRSRTRARARRRA